MTITSGWNVTSNEKKSVPGRGVDFWHPGSPSVHKNKATFHACLLQKSHCYCDFRDISRVFLGIFCETLGDDELLNIHLFQVGLSIHPITTGRVKSVSHHLAQAALPSSISLHFSTKYSCIQSTDLKPNQIQRVMESHSCWWLKSGDHQLRLVVYPIIYRVLYIPGG